MGTMIASLDLAAASCSNWPPHSTRYLLVGKLTFVLICFWASVTKLPTSRLRTLHWMVILRCPHSLDILEGPRIS